MLRIDVIQQDQRNTFTHEQGPLEFGRGPEREARRIRIDDKTISRDQLRVQELPGGRLGVENLSIRNEIELDNGATIGIGERRELKLPARLTMHGVTVELECLAPLAGNAEAEAAGKNEAASAAGAATTKESPHELSVLNPQPRVPTPQSVVLGPEASVQESLIECLQAVLFLECADAGSAEFYDQVASALVTLLGLDLGLVFAKDKDKFVVRGRSGSDMDATTHFSNSLLRHVVQTRQTIYQDLSSPRMTATSLAGVEAVVVTPILGADQDVIGVLYGVRYKNPIARGGIQKLEAQIVQLLAAVAGAQIARAEAARTRIHFEQFFSQAVVRELQRNPNALQGRNQEVSVLVSDLRGFTALSERLGAQETCELVQDMMERMTARVWEQGGVVVSYAGDGLLAMWNAPCAHDDHPARACRAALAMLEEMQHLNAKWSERLGSTLAIGIGVNTGVAHVGNTGSSHRFMYGPLGHTVNLASRLQVATKRLRVPILVAEPVLAQVRNQFAFRRLGRFHLAGVQESVALYELHGQAATHAWAARRDLYETALMQYESKQWSKACQTLVPLLDLGNESDHDDLTVRKLLQMSLQRMGDAGKDFDGVLDTITK